MPASATHEWQLPVREQIDFTARNGVSSSHLVAPARDIHRRTLLKRDRAGWARYSAKSAAAPKEAKR